MLTEIAEILYTRIFKPPLIRNLVNRTILFVLPEFVRYEKAIIFINPQDPVVSGALFFRVYERDEAAFMGKHLGSGDLFIDIGANVGFYTALAMHRVGSEGMVLAFEPDPESYRLLERTINANLPANVQAYQLAVSSGEAERQLYISSDNRGDNRLHAFADASASITIHTVAIDSIIEELGLVVDGKNVFVKLDIQGSEALAIEGMKKLLHKAREVILMMEFWPQGLMDMGSDPLGLLSKLRNAGLLLYKLGSRGGLSAIENDVDLIDNLSGRKYTNIIARRS